MQGLKKTPPSMLIVLAFLLGHFLTNLFQGQTPMSWAAAPHSPKQFSECFAATTWWARGADVNRGKLARKMVKIPEGWSVVGAGAGPIIMLCR